MARSQRQGKPCVGGKKNGHGRNFDGNRSGRTAFHCGGGGTFHQRVLPSRPGEGPQSVANQAHTLLLGVGGVYESAAHQALSTASYSQHQQRSKVHGQARCPKGAAKMRGKGPAAAAAGGFDARGAGRWTRKERLGVSMKKNEQGRNSTGRVKRSDEVGGSCTFPSTPPERVGNVKASVATDLSTGAASNHLDKSIDGGHAATGRETIEAWQKAARIIEGLGRRAEREMGLPEKGQELCSERQIRQHLTWQRACRIGPGFQNTGNTCYLNSVLQCLSYLPPVAQHLLDNRYQATIAAATTPGSAKKGTADVSNNGVLKAVQTLIGEVHQVVPNATQQTIKPSFFSTNIKYIGKRFRQKRQEDAHEFLRHLVERMVGGYVQRSGADTSASKRLAETTPVHRIFEGHLRNQLKCASCGYCSNNYEPFMDLSLDLEKMDADRRETTSFTSVHSALGNFTATETLDASNKWQCHGCEKLVEAEKTLSVFKPPNALVMHLKRFGFAGSAGKIKDHVHFEEKLNLDVSGPERRVAYDLTGVVVHKGASTSRGHYLAYVRSSDGWARMNDTIVTRVELDTVLKSNAYILFYTRRLASSPLADSFPGSSQSSSGVSSPTAADGNGPLPADGGDQPTLCEAKRSRKRGRKQEPAVASAAAAATVGTTASKAAAAPAPNTAKASAAATTAATTTEAGTTAVAGAENGKSDESPRCKKPRLSGIPGATENIGESADVVEITSTSPALVPERAGRGEHGSSGNCPGGESGEKGAAVKDSAGEGVDAAPRLVSPSAPKPLPPVVEQSTDAVPRVAAGKRSREEGASSQTGARSRKVQRYHSCKNGVKSPGPSLSPPVNVPLSSAVSGAVARKRAREDSGRSPPDADVSGAPLRTPEVQRVQGENPLEPRGYRTASATPLSVDKPLPEAMPGVTSTKRAREDGAPTQAEEGSGGHPRKSPKMPRR